MKPKILSVFGRKIKVYYKNITDCVGYTDYKKIVIKTKIKEDYRIEVILHELFHCALERTGIKQAELSHDLEEIIVDNLAKVVNENFLLTVKKSKD